MQDMRESAPPFETGEQIIQPDADAKAASVPAKKSWTAFVESDAAAFFVDYSLERMTLDDGSGNKAKFSRLKDGNIRLEYTSSILI